MSPGALTEWILRILQCEGPQDFTELMGLLKSDSSHGYVPLRDPQFEAKVRTALLDHSGETSQLFIQAFNYKWHALSSMSFENRECYTIPRNKPWLEIGYGPETVYGVFFPSTMRENIKSKCASYPIKIGRTARPLPERMFELQTGNYLDLQVGLAIHTESASILENYLHDLLGHRKIQGGGSQSEWFLTNLEYVARHSKSKLEAIGA